MKTAKQHNAPVEEMPGLSEALKLAFSPQVDVLLKILETLYRIEGQLQRTGTDVNPVVTRDKFR